MKSELGGDKGDYFGGTYLFSSEVALIKSPKSTSKTGIISEDGPSVFAATYAFPIIDGAESNILQSSSVNTSPSLLFVAFFYYAPVLLILLCPSISTEMLGYSFLF